MNESKIDDNTFVRFIMNDMTREEMQHTEDQLLRDGEGAAVLVCSTAIWNTTPNALDIIGDKQSINNSEKDRSEFDDVSILANELKNSTNMVRLTKQDGNAIKQIIEAYTASADSNLSLEENLKNFYLKECPGVFPEDAENIIAGVKEGITRFDSAFAQMVSADDFQVEQIVNDALKEKSLEEQYNILLNFLVALHALQADNVKAEDGTFNESFDQIKDRLYKAGVPVTEEMIAELIAKIKDVFENGTCTLSSAEAVDDLLKNLEKSEEDVKLYVAGQENLFQQKMILSTAIMVGVHNNSIESLQGQEVSPQVIGSGVSAGLEQQKLLSDLQAGNTTLDTVLTVLKYIGAAALICAGIYFGYLAIMSVSGLVIGALSAIFGLSTFALLLSIFCTVMMVTLPMANSYGSAMNYLLGKAGDLYDWVVSKITGKSTDSETAFVNWLNFKIENGEVVEEEAAQAEEPDTMLA